MMEETQVSVTDESYDYDSFDEQSDERPTERWAPLGAAATSPAPYHSETRYIILVQIRSVSFLSLLQQTRRLLTASEYKQ